MPSRLMLWANMNKTPAPQRHSTNLSSVFQRLTVATRNICSTYVLALVCCVTACLATQPAQAQFDDLFGDLDGGAPSKPEISAKLVLNAAPQAGKPQTGKLEVTVTVPEGYYIYDVQGTFDGRTKIKTKLPEGVKSTGEFTSIKPAQKAFEPLFGVDIYKLYDGTTWVLPVEFSQSVDLATVSISGSLEGQYCSSGEGGQCLPIIPALKFDAKVEGDLPIAPAPSGETAPAVVKAPAAPPVMLPFEKTERLKRSGKAQPLEFTVKLSPTDAKPGETVNLQFTAKIDSGYHIFSMTQPDGIGGAPTVVEFDQMTGLTEAGKFTPDHPHEIEPGDNGSLEVYYDKVTWTKPFKVNAGVKPGEYGLSGVIRSQACTDSSCVPMPKFAFALGAQGNQGEVPPVAGSTPAATAVPDKAPVPSAEPSEKTRKEISLAAQAVNSNEFDDEILAEKEATPGTVGYLVTAFLAGWLALLTPCAFPMVPITVSFFLKQGQGKSLSLAIVYCLAIIATFTLLGVGLAVIFGAAFVNQLANNPIMNIVIGGIFVAFGLSMLGLFEIQPPSWLLTYTANQESAGGYLGVMFMALTFTLTSFTCTFPVAGTILVAASQGDVLWPIMGMLAFSSAFALPFFFLALFPSLLKKLPKSGGWLFTLKIVLGFVEIAAAMKFFSVADLKLNPQPVLFDFAFVMVAWSVLAVTAALYLLGVFNLAHDQPQDRISPLQALAGTSFMGLALFLMVGVLTPEKAGGVVMPQILAFAPPQLNQSGFKETPELGPMVVHNGIPFALDVDRAITLAKSRQQPLFFDFTGVNCVNCRLMERKMSEPENHARLERFLGTQLYADRVPHITDEKYANSLVERNIGLQEKWFNDVTLPAYVIVAPDGKTILSVYKGLERKNGEFAAFLDKGWKGFEKWKAKQVAGNKQPTMAPEKEGVSARSAEHTEKSSAAVGKPIRTVGKYQIALDVNHAIQQSQALKQPLLIHVTSVNDVNSVLTERQLFQDKNYGHLQNFLLSQLYFDRLPQFVDDAHGEALLKENSETLSRFDLSPIGSILLIVTPDGKTILRSYAGSERNEGEIAAFLDKGMKQFEAWNVEQMAQVSQESSSH